MLAKLSFNRRRDACFPATTSQGHEHPHSCQFQSQTRRLLPRNFITNERRVVSTQVSIADATLASPQPFERPDQRGYLQSFNRRRDACFPATSLVLIAVAYYLGFQSQTRRLLPRNEARSWRRKSTGQSFNRRRDACFPATRQLSGAPRIALCFNRRRDACFPATLRRQSSSRNCGSFNRRRDACFPATDLGRLRRDESGHSFNRRRDACFPATKVCTPQVQRGRAMFQSQTRRLLPRNYVGAGCALPQY